MPRHGPNVARVGGSGESHPPARGPDPTHGGPGAGHDTDPGHAHPGHTDPGGDHHSHPGGVRGLLVRLVSPHSHDSSGTVADALSATDEGVRALEVSLVALALTAVVQLLVVLVSGSVALLSDTIHNFADALTAVPLGVAFWIGRRPANRRYNYGYGRAEDLAGIFIVAIIGASSVLAALEALSRLRHPEPISHLPWVVAAGLIGFVGNESVAMYRIRVGTRIGSAALVADGRHARSDGITSLAVVAGAIGVAAGWQRADPVVGLAITAAILLVLKNAARDIYRRLMDSVDPDLVSQAERSLLEVQGVESVDSVRLRWVGHELRAEADIACDPRLTIAEGHAIAERALHKILHDLPRLSQATIHTNPYSEDGTEAHQMTAHHFSPPRGSPRPDR